MTDIKIDYFDLQSPFDYYVEGIGYFKKHKLSDIGDSRKIKNGYWKRINYLSILSLDKSQFITQFGLEDIYNNFTNEQKSILTIFDLIVFNNMGEYFKSILSFFICGEIKYFPQQGYYQIDTDGKINRDNFDLVKSVIFQINHMEFDGDDLSEEEYQSEEAKEAIRMIKQGREESAKCNKNGKDFNLSNLISALFPIHPDIWNWTIYQLYDVFQRENNNYYLDFIKLNYAFNGKNIDSNQWYKPIN